jgi:hypothetical protein
VNGPASVEAVPVALTEALTAAHPRDDPDVFCLGWMATVGVVMDARDDLGLSELIEMFEEELDSRRTP